MISYSDTNGSYRGTFINGVFTLWNKYISKKEYNFTITLSKLDEALNNFGNSNFAIYSLVRDKLYNAQDSWVYNSSTDKLRERRAYFLYEDCDRGRGSAADSLSIDSALEKWLCLRK